jgi:hypothetical protein
MYALTGYVVRQTLLHYFTYFICEAQWFILLSLPKPGPRHVRQRLGISYRDSDSCALGRVQAGSSSQEAKWKAMCFPNDLSGRYLLGWEKSPFSMSAYVDKSTIGHLKW